MFARTPRLLLRPGWQEDVPAVHEAINDEAIVRMLARAPWPYEPEDAANWLASETDPLRPAFLIFERTKGEPRLIGSAGLGQTDDGQTEIGYWLRRSHWGRGFATEAGHAVMDIARSLGHRHLSSGHFEDNPASGHVLRKLGFRPTGRVEQRHSKGRGGTVPCVLFSCDLAGVDPADDPAGDTECGVMRSLAA